MQALTDSVTRIIGWVKCYQERGPAWLRITLALAWAALIWWASSQSPDPSAPDVFNAHVWNLGHVVVFGVLAALFLLSTQGCTARNALIAITVTAAYGAIDELHQQTVAGRAMDVWDACSDSLGACIGACALLWLIGGRRGAGLLLCLWVPLAAISVHMASA